MTFRLRQFFTQNAICLALLLGLVACQTAEANGPTAEPGSPVVSATVSPRSTWTPVPVVEVVTAVTVPPPVLPRAKPAEALVSLPTTTDSAARALAQDVTLTATPGSVATLIPSPTQAAAVATLIPTNTRRPTVMPSMTVLPSPSPVRTVISTAVPGPFGGDPATWTPPASTAKFREHYVFQRPIGADHTNFWARNYSYGSTDGGTRPIHHGIDLQNETGTPVLAAGDGVVFYAGPDKTTLFGPQPDFYGNVVVIQHPMTDVAGQIIYTLYGHLSKVEATTGQRVKEGQEIGLVGSAGVAIGAHLHFEVRAGNPTDYNSTRNPELWILPYQGDGVIAGRVRDLAGNAVPGVQVEVQSGDVYRFANTYADNTVTGDAIFGENFVVPDLPAGYYYIYIKLPEGGLKFKTLTYVQNGRTNVLDIFINVNP